MPRQNSGATIDTFYNANMDLQALAGTQLGGPTLWGVAPTGEEVQGVNAYITDMPPVVISGVGISTYGSPAQTGLNVFVLNPITVENNVEVTVTNIPEVTINGVGTTCTGGGGSSLTQLGTAGQYSLLGYSGISNSGSSTVLGGNIGSFPTDSVTGFPPGLLTAPAAYVTATAQNQTDLAAAIVYYQGLPYTQTLTTADMGTQNSAGAPVGTYYAGVYHSGSTLAINTPITLDAQGDSNAVFVFLAGSTITQQIAGTINLINGANPCNVIWVAGSSFTAIGPGAVTVGTILAEASITLGGGSLNGRALANTGSVTISTAEVITTPVCSGSGECGLNAYIVNDCLNVCGLTFTEVGSPAVSTLNVIDATSAASLAAIEATLDSVIGTAGSPAVPVLNVNVVNSATSGACVTQCTTPWVDDVHYWNGVALGSPTAWGTAPTGNVIGVNADLFAGGTGLTTTTAGSPAVASLNVYITGTEVGSGGGFQYLNGSTPGSVTGTAALGIDAGGVVHVLNTTTDGTLEVTVGAPSTSLLTLVVINVAVGAGSGDHTIIAVPCRIFEMDLQVSGLGATSSTITFKDGATALTGPYFALNGWSWSRDNNGDYAFKCATSFIINNSTAAQLSGYIKYQS
jgi:hypothetical protein